MRAILTWHSIDSSASPVSVAPEEFRRHAAWLASGRVRVVDLEALVGPDADGDMVALTFDDGFMNLADHALPLLLDHGLQATIFVVAGHAGGTNAWGGRSDPRVPTLPLLGWDALGRLAEQGIRLGAHTRTHPRLTTVSAGALEDELGGAAETIRRETGRDPTTFAYPYGDVDTRVAEAAGRRYRLCCTTQLRMLRADEDCRLLPRLDMYYFRGAGRLEAWGSARFGGRLWLRAQARRLRGALTRVGGGR